MFSFIANIFSDYFLWISSIGVILVLLLVQYYSKIYWNRTAKLINKFPGAPILPFLGNTAVFCGSPSQIRSKIHGYFATYGKCCKLWIFDRPKVFIADAEVCQAVLSSSEQIDKGEPYSSLKDLLGLSLVNSGGPAWKRHRKILNSAFSRKFNDTYLKVFNSQSRILLEELKQKFHLNSKPQDIHMPLFLCAMDMIFESSTGLDMNCQIDGIYSPFVKAISAYRDGMKIRLLKPWLTWPYIRDLVGYKKKEISALKFAKDLIKTKIERKTKNTTDKSTTTKEEVQNNTITTSEKRVRPKGPPFMDALLEAGEKFTDDEYFNYLIGIVSAGSGPIVSSVLSTIYFLVQNPEHMKKVEEEIGAILNGDLNHNISNRDISKMAFLEMCIKESMRLFPPIPFISRKIVFDVKLKNGLIIPKESDAVFSIYHLHRDIYTFPDPNEFIPERFTPEECEKRNPYSYLPFSVGIRNCIGNKYALIQSMVMIIHILANFEVSTDKKDTDIGYDLPFMAKPYPAIKLTLNSKNNL